MPSSMVCTYTIAVCTYYCSLFRVYISQFTPGFTIYIVLSCAVVVRLLSKLKCNKSPSKIVNVSIQQLGKKWTIDSLMFSHFFRCSKAMGFLRFSQFNNLGNWSAFSACPGTVETKTNNLSWLLAFRSFNNLLTIGFQLFHDSCATKMNNLL